MWSNNKKELVDNRYYVVHVNNNHYYTRLLYMGGLDMFVDEQDERHGYNSADVVRWIEWGKAIEILENVLTS